MSARYRSNAPRFVDETVDGEALIMDMVKGSYYSCIGASAAAWNALKSGTSVAEVSESLVSTYGIAAGDATRDVEQFVDALLSEEMLVEVADATPQSTPGTELGNATPHGGYSALCLERYTDLADLILLDPVHDVTEAGWPHPTT
jgi:Coenzyme PQQ synthesis protein D (PqqD)